MQGFIEDEGPATGTSCSCVRTATSSCNAGASCRCGTVGRGKETLPLRAQAPWGTTATARAHRRNTNSQGEQARRTGRNKSCGEKAKGLASQGFIGRRKRPAYETGSSLSTFVFLFSLSSLPPSLSRKFGARHREGSKAGRFVPGRPTASGGWSGLSLLLNRIMLVRAFFFTTAKCHSATLYGNAGKTNRRLL